jgi:hypothetical protein
MISKLSEVESLHYSAQKEERASDKKTQALVGIANILEQHRFGSMKLQESARQDILQEISTILKTHE